MVDGGGERRRTACRAFSSNACGGVHIFLRPAPRGARPSAWRLRPRIPSARAVSVLNRRSSSGTSVCLLGEFDRRRAAPSALPIAGISVSRRLRRYLSMSLSIGLIGIQQPVGGGAIGAQIMHRLEQVRRGIGDHRDTARHLQPSPGIPGVERESRSTTQKAVARMTVFSSADTVKRFSMNAAPKIPAIWAKNGKHLDSCPAGISTGAANALIP